MKIKKIDFYSLFHTIYCTSLDVIWLSLRQTPHIQVAHDSLKLLIQPSLFNSEEICISAWSDRSEQQSFVFKMKYTHSKIHFLRNISSFDENYRVVYNQPFEQIDKKRYSDTRQQYRITRYTSMGCDGDGMWVAVSGTMEQQHEVTVNQFVPI